MDYAKVRPELVQERDQLAARVAQLTQAIEALDRIYLPKGHHPMAARVEDIPARRKPGRPRKDAATGPPTEPPKGRIHRTLSAVAKGPNGRAQRILDAVKKGYKTPKDIADHLNISRYSVQGDLAPLLFANLVHRTGRRPRIEYHPGPNQPTS